MRLVLSGDFNAVIIFWISIHFAMNVAALFTLSGERQDKTNIDIFDIVALPVHVTS